MNSKFANAIILIVSSVIMAACAQQLHILPSQMVSLGEYTKPGQTQIVKSGNPDGTGGGVFTVPAGKVLVITNVIIHPMTPNTGILDITLMQSDSQLGDRIRQTWRVPNSQPTQFNFSPGYVISSGSQLMIKNADNSSGDVHVSFYGYVASDK